MPEKKYRKVDAIADYKTVFNSPAGKRVLYDLMKQGNFLYSSYQGDIHDMAFREGERNIVNYILTMLKQDIKTIRDEIKKREEEELEYV